MHGYSVFIKALSWFVKLKSAFVTLYQRLSVTFCPPFTFILRAAPQDAEAMASLLNCAGDLEVTLHRAFDMCREPYEALESAKKLGIQTILTSGQRKNCTEGRELIAGLVKESGGKVDIMAGGGVDAGVICRMLPVTDAPAWHMSGKEVLESGMEYRRPEVSMGIPGLGEYQIFRTAEDKIGEARRVLDRYMAVPPLNRRQG